MVMWSRPSARGRAPRIGRRLPTSQAPDSHIAHGGIPERAHTWHHVGVPDWVEFRRSDATAVIELVRRVAGAADPGEHGDGVEGVIAAPRRGRAGPLSDCRGVRVEGVSMAATAATLTDEDLRALSAGQRHALARKLAELAGPESAAGPRPAQRRHVVAVAFLLCLALAAWTLRLGASLPRRHLVGHRDPAWGGFGPMLCACLAATGAATRRGRPVPGAAAPAAGGA